MEAILHSEIVARLAAGAEIADVSPEWPSGWGILRESGLAAWSIPTMYGGAGRDSSDVLRASELIASACLTTAFIFSQREAAVRRVLTGPAILQERFLPSAAAGADFLTIGVSQITTSRQHGGPALRATPLGSQGYRLDGEIPWVTGADQAKAIVVGATLADRSQILLLLPVDTAGVLVESPMNLASLRGSRTSLVRCANVEVGMELLIAGPSEHVLGTAGGGGLETSCLALGLAGAAIEYLRAESANRPNLSPFVDQFEIARVAARNRLHELATISPDPEGTLALRVNCTRLALQATQAELLAAKGTGFVSPHVAQRHARQALFFLVWSCPRPVSEQVLAGLMPGQQ